MPPLGGATWGTMSYDPELGLVYVGTGYTGSGALTRWAIENGFAFDEWAVPNGMAYRARYERYLTDPKIQPLKTKWEVEVAIKLMDD